MDYISTSVLANELEIKSNDLFNKQETLNWIERINDKWILTRLGKHKGGQTRTSAKFGVYIVWPENISIDHRPKNEALRLLNATVIGKHFDISSQRLNLISPNLVGLRKI